jgi:hypothetical protein
MFAVSMQVIERTLQLRLKIDLYIKLLKYYYDYIEVFSRDAADTLPPHRAGVDYKTELEVNEDGREKKAPWGPL